MAPDSPTKPSTKPSTKPTGLFRRTLRRHWVGLLATWVIGFGVAGALVHYQFQPVYQASSLIRVEPITSSLFGIKTSEEPFDLFVQTQVQLLLSPNVLSLAGANPKVAGLPRIQKAGDVVLELRNAVQVAVLPGTYLIKVSTTSPDPKEAATIVNAVVESYLASNEDWAYGMARTQVKNLEVYLHDLKNQTEDLEGKWKELVATNCRDITLPNANRADNPDAKHLGKLLIEDSRRLKDAMLDVQIELVEAQAWADALKADVVAGANRKDDNKFTAIIERKFKADPEVSALIPRMLEANEKVESIKRIVHVEDDPALKRAQRNLDDLKTTYNQLWETKSVAFREELELTSGLASDERQLRDAEAEVRKLKIKEAALLGLAEQMKGDIARQATDAVNIQLILDQRASIKAMQDTVNRRLEQLRFEARGETRVRLVNRAIPTDKPVADSRPLVLAVTPIAVLFLFAGFLTIERLAGPKVRTTPVAADKPEPITEA